jgi:hypothetical protein
MSKVILTHPRRFFPCVKAVRITILSGETVG